MTRPLALTEVRLPGRNSTRPCVTLCRGRRDKRDRAERGEQIAALPDLPGRQVERAEDGIWRRNWCIIVAAIVIVLVFGAPKGNRRPSR